MRKRWTNEETEFLRKYYPDYGLKYCLKHLNRSVNQIRAHAQQMNIKINRISHGFKVCDCCFIKKPLSDFSPNKVAKFGVQPKCRPCNVKYYQEWRNNNKEQNYLNRHRFYEKHKSKLLTQRKSYYYKNIEIIKKSVKKYNIRNRAKILERGREYYHKNKKIIREKAKAYNALLSTKEKRRIYSRNHEKTVLKYDLNYRIKKLLQARILTALKKTRANKIRKNSHAIGLFNR